MNTVLRLFSFLKRYKRRAASAYLCLLVTTLLGLAFPYLIKVVIDGALSGEQGNFLILAAVALVAITVVQAAFAFGQGYLNESVSQRIAFDVRTALYDKMQRLSFAFHDRAQTGDLMSRSTSDVDSVRLFFNSGLMNGLNVILTFLAVTAVLVSTDWRLALVSLSLIPVLGLRAVLVARKLRSLFMTVQRQLARMAAVLHENIAGVRVVKAFAREEFEIDKFGRENHQLMLDTMAAVRQWSFNFPFMSFIVSLSTALILWYGGREVLDGRLTIGGLVAFNGYLMMLAWPVRSLGWVMNLFARAASSGERIFEILDAPYDVSEAPDALPMPRIKGHLRFENVSFGYDPEHPILRDISFEVEEGQTVALVGRTGSGKSSLVSMIPRFYDPTAGRITIDGIDVSRVTLSSLRKQIGIVLQETFLFSATVLENLAYGAEGATMQAIEAAARDAHAYEFIKSLPDGYGTLVGERGITLSGGQRQRIAIARTLLLDPPILILDDSTSSVDMETEYLIQEALRVLMQGRTTIVIAQRLTTIKRADLILVIEDGRIVERGAHAELMEHGRAYQEIYDINLRDQEEASSMVGGGPGLRD
ncbi:MAG: ABC transporter ATP-binding protein [Dehalococcoidia bacterium]|nr:ABC transporter ATP-binding protein [Dehalococcoidia bacterium]